MESYFLTRNNYTVCNALTWGNCRQHARAACEATSWSHRIVHSFAAFVLFFPIVSQIFSLFEMSVAHLILPTAHDLTTKSVRLIKMDELNHEPLCHLQVKEESLPHKFRQKKQTVSPLPLLNVKLSGQETDRDFYEALFPMHRALEGSYRDFPWPSDMQNIVVRTKVTGGRGDIAAAAKVIDYMKQFSASLKFDWILAADQTKYDPKSFLNNPTHVSIRYEADIVPNETPGDMLIVGPAEDIGELHSIETRIQRKIQGPLFMFAENASSPGGLVLKIEFNSCKNKAEKGKSYSSLHETLFSSHQSNENCSGYLPMGIKKGTGVFFNPELIGKSLSRGYCCPSYLSQISDDSLRNDIAMSMKGESSFNSGYAHHLESWANCIDCFAMHEKNKHMVIVLNQKGEFSRSTLSIEQFKDQIFTEDRLAFLKKLGYGTVMLKGEGEKAFILQQENPETTRRLIVIIRPSFKPTDMRCIQLFSDRLLATGDNTAIEAWLVRCILYLYEDVANQGCKDIFLQQQVDLAETISHDLAQLLAFFGGDKRQAEFPLHQFWNAEQRAKIQILLEKPELSDATLQFCDRVVDEYSFEPAFEGALKRTIWLHKKPALVKIEKEELAGFGARLVEYLKHPAPVTIPADLSILTQRLKEACAH